MNISNGAGSYSLEICQSAIAYYIITTIIHSPLDERNHMDKETQDQKKFFEELLEWTKKRDNILEEIEHKLYEMKEIAEYALDHDLTTDEVARLNRQLDDKKREVQSLEKQLQSVVH